MSNVQALIKGIANGQHPSADELKRALTHILQGESNDAQIAALLLGLEMSGVTAADVSAGVDVMHENMVPVEIPYDVIDIVGTGGTGLHTLSISTATAIVCAGAGAKVAKHGNRAASSLSGTADTLSTLGVNLAMTPEKAKDCVDKAGIGFLFAPNHHPAMRFVGPARKAMGIRTLFNMLGPLSNPARAQYMLLGVCQDKWRRPMAEALVGRVKHAWVVHGSDGMDEITTTGVTHVSEVKDGTVSDFSVKPSDYGLKSATLDELTGGEPSVNAKALAGLLDRETGAYRDIVLLNAGVALYLSGIASDVTAGIRIAATAIDTGKAKAALDRLIEVSNG